MAREGKIELVDDGLDLGGDLHVRFLRPREPGRLLDDAVAEGARDAPYWAELWPSARALAAHVATLDLAGRRAIELGCGLALPSVAAAHRGASVLAVDHDADAVRIACRNGASAPGDMRGLVADLESAFELVARGPFDLVLAADVLYEPVLAGAVATLIPSLVAPGGSALVTFPWRGQARELARSLEAHGMVVAFRELSAPGLERSRAVELLEALR